MNLLKQARSATTDYRRRLDTFVRENQKFWEERQNQEELAQAKLEAQEAVDALCERIVEHGPNATSRHNMEHLSVEVREMLIKLLFMEGFRVNGDHHDTSILINLPKSFHHADGPWSPISQSHFRQCEGETSWPMY